MEPTGSMKSFPRGVYCGRLFSCYYATGYGGILGQFEAFIAFAVLLHYQLFDFNYAHNWIYDSSLK